MAFLVLKAKGERFKVQGFWLISSFCWTWLGGKRVKVKGWTGSSLQAYSFCLVRLVMKGKRLLASWTWMKAGERLKV